MDLGVPILDLAFWLVGYPRITRVTAVFRSGEADVEEAATVFAVSESGIAFSVEVSWNLFAESDRHHCPRDGHRGFRLPAPAGHPQATWGDGPWT